jgi:hypothetical protein
MIPTSPTYLWPQNSSTAPAKAAGLPGRPAAILPRCSRR